MTSPDYSHRRRQHSRPRLRRRYIAASLLTVAVASSATSVMVVTGPSWASPATAALPQRS